MTHTWHKTRAALALLVLVCCTYAHAADGQCSTAFSKQNSNIATAANETHYYALRDFIDGRNTFYRVFSDGGDGVPPPTVNQTVQEYATSEIIDTALAVSEDQMPLFNGTALRAILYESSSEPVLYNVEVQTLLDENSGLISTIITFDLPLKVVCYDLVIASEEVIVVDCVVPVQQGGYEDAFYVLDIDKSTQTKINVSTNTYSAPPPSKKVALLDNMSKTYLLSSASNDTIKYYFIQDYTTITYCGNVTSAEIQAGVGGDKNVAIVDFTALPTTTFVLDARGNVIAFPFNGTHALDFAYFLRARDATRTPVAFAIAHEEADNDQVAVVYTNGALEHYFVSGSSAGAQPRVLSYTLTGKDGQTFALDGNDTSASVSIGLSYLAVAVQGTGADFFYIFAKDANAEHATDADVHQAVWATPAGSALNARFVEGTDFLTITKASQTVIAYAADAVLVFAATRATQAQALQYLTLLGSSTDRASGYEETCMTNFNSYVLDDQSAASQTPSIRATNVPLPRSVPLADLETQWSAYINDVAAPYLAPAITVRALDSDVSVQQTASARIAVPLPAWNDTANSTRAAHVYSVAKRAGAFYAAQDTLDNVDYCERASKTSVDGVKCQTVTGLPRGTATRRVLTFAPGTRTADARLIVVDTETQVTYVYDLIAASAGLADQFAFPPPKGASLVAVTYQAPWNGSQVAFENYFGVQVDERGGDPESTSRVTLRGTQVRLDYHAVVEWPPYVADSERGFAPERVLTHTDARNTVFVETPYGILVCTVSGEVPRYGGFIAYEEPRTRAYLIAARTLVTVTPGGTITEYSVRNTRAPIAMKQYARYSYNVVQWGGQAVAAGSQLTRRVYVLCTRDTGLYALVYTPGAPATQVLQQVVVIDANVVLNASMTIAIAVSENAQEQATAPSDAFDVLQVTYNGAAHFFVVPQTNAFYVQDGVRGSANAPYARTHNVTFETLSFGASSVPPLTQTVSVTFYNNQTRLARNDAAISASRIANISVAYSDTKPHKERQYVYDTRTWYGGASILFFNASLTNTTGQVVTVKNYVHEMPRVQFLPTLDGAVSAYQDDNDGVVYVLTAVGQGQFEQYHVQVVHANLSTLAAGPFRVNANGGRCTRVVKTVHSAAPNGTQYATGVLCGRQQENATLTKIAFRQTGIIAVYGNFSLDVPIDAIRDSDIIFVNDQLLAVHARAQVVMYALPQTTNASDLLAQRVCAYDSDFLGLQALDIVDFTVVLPPPLPQSYLFLLTDSSLRRVVALSVATGNVSNVMNTDEIDVTRVLGTRAQYYVSPRTRALQTAVVRATPANDTSTLNVTLLSLTTDTPVYQLECTFNKVEKGEPLFETFFKYAACAVARVHNNYGQGVTPVARIVQDVSHARYFSVLYGSATRDGNAVDRYVTVYAFNETAPVGYAQPFLGGAVAQWQQHFAVLALVDRGKSYSTGGAQVAVFTAGRDTPYESDASVQVLGVQHYLTVTIAPAYIPGNRTDDYTNVLALAPYTIYADETPAGDLAPVVSFVRVHYAPPDNGGGKGGSLTGWQIALIVGGVALVLGGAFLWYWNRRKRQQVQEGAALLAQTDSEANSAGASRQQKSVYSDDRNRREYE